MPAPLIGRAAELRDLVAGTARCTPVVGPAGVGRTRLLEAAVERLRADGRPVIAVRGTSSDRMRRLAPLGPFLHKLSLGATDTDRGGHVARASQALADWLGPGGVVAVDDAHLLDSDTAEVLQQLVDGRSVAVLLAVESHVRDVPGVLHRLVASSAPDAVRLAPFDHTETTRLVRALLGGTVGTDPLRALWEETGGYPLLLVELVEAALRSGSLRDDAGAWELTGPLRSTPTLVERTRGRYGRLNARQREAAGLLAVARALPPDAARHLTAAADLHVLADLGFARIEDGPQGPQVALAHPLDRLVLRETQPLPEARRHAAALAGRGVLAAAGRVLTDEQRLRADLEAARGDRELEAAAVAFARGLVGSVGRSDNAIERLRLVRDGVGDAAARARLLVEVARLSVGRGDLDGALTASGEVLDGGAAEAVELGAIRIRSLAQVMRGHVRDAHASVDRGRSLAVAGDGGAARERQLLEVSRTLARVYAGQLDPTEPAAEDERPAAGGDPTAGALRSSARVEADLLTGRLDRAVPAATAAGALVDREDPFGVRALVEAQLAVAEASTGRTDAAREALGRSEGRAVDVHQQVRARWARAWVTAAAGKPGDGVAPAVDAGQRAREAGHAVWALLAFHTAVRLDVTDGVLEPLLEVAAAVEGDLAPALAAHARAVAAGDGPALEAASAGFGALGAVLLAAEAASQAAARYAHEGRGQPARAAFVRAARLACRCPYARTPALRGAALTDRERQVCVGAVLGRSNPEIAEELGLSVRTVNNHLSRAYGKLDVSARGDLGAVAGVVVPVDTVEPASSRSA